MKIYIDADAFPNVIKDILIRASERLNVPLVFVANKPLRVKTSANISVVVVGEGTDVADDRIAGLAQTGDLIITSDIPLADQLDSFLIRQLKVEKALFTLPLFPFIKEE
jgi:uncharacterized protein